MKIVIGFRPTTDHVLESTSIKMAANIVYKKAPSFLDRR